MVLSVSVHSIASEAKAKAAIFWPEPMIAQVLLKCSGRFLCIYLLIDYFYNLIFLHLINAFYFHAAHLFISICLVANISAISPGKMSVFV